MHFNTYRLPILLLAFLWVGTLAGCQTARSNTVAPAFSTAIALTQQAIAYPAENEAQAGYPAQASQPTQAAYPEPNATPGAENNMDPSAASDSARENISRITAKLITRGADPANPAQVKLHAEILTSQSIPGKYSATNGLIHQQVDLLAESANLPDLKAGDTFECVAVFRGDEENQGYFVSEIKKLSQ